MQSLVDHVQMVGGTRTKSFTDLFPQMGSTSFEIHLYIDFTSNITSRVQRKEKDIYYP